MTRRPVNLRQRQRGGGAIVVASDEARDEKGRLKPGYRYSKGAIVRAKNWSEVYGQNT